MGRFYKTSAQTPVDYMYQLPKELMMGALLATDKKVDKSITSADEAQKKLDLIKNLKGDNQYVADKYSAYENKIANVAQEIRDNPMGYNALGEKMRGISREIEQDVTRGGLFQAQQQYNDFEAYKELTNKRDDIDEVTKKDLIDVSEKRYNALNYEDPSTFNSIKKHTIAGYAKVDEDKLINVLADNFKADKTGWASAGVNGMYITTASGTTEERTPEQVKRVIDASLESSGWEDFNREQLMLAQEQGRIPADANLDNLLMERRKTLVGKAVDKLGYKETTADKSISGDSMYSTKKQEELEKVGVERKNDTGSAEEHALVAKENATADYLAAKGAIPGAKNTNEIMLGIASGKGASFNEVYGIMKANGAFNSEKPKEEYAAWVQGNLNSDITYTPASKQVVNTYNSRSVNNPSTIYFRDANNNRVKSSRTSLGDYVAHMQKKGVIILDPTAEIPAEAPASATKIASTTKGKATAPPRLDYSFRGEDYKTENLKKKTSYTVNVRGEITPKTSYVDVVKVNTYDPARNVYNVVEVEIEVPEDRISNPKQK